jgi:multiple sugar transport system permease protein
MAVAVSEAYAGPGWLQRNKMAVTPILFLLPGLLFFGLYVIIPIFQSFNISLYAGTGWARRPISGWPITKSF